jgi:hypothetical protein
LNQTTNITLEVFDISCYEWKEAGENQSYTETGEWQLLSWANVTNVSAVDSAGVASYRFFFFDAGARRGSEVFYGPELDLYPTPTPTPTVIYSGGGGGGGGGLTWRKLLSDEKLMGELAEKVGGILPAYEEIKHPEIINAAVTPERGSWNESFDYWVEVVHPNKAEMWLTLKVYSPATKENYTISTRKINSSMYDESNIATVEWRDVKVFSEEDVKAEESPKYYILYNDSCNYGSREFTGPKLNSAPNLSYPMVIPEKGTYRDLFVYKVNVTDEDGDDVEVTLHIVNSEGNWTNETQVISGIEAKRGKTERWIYNEFTEADVNIKGVEYYFSAYDGIDEAEEDVGGKGPKLFVTEQILLGGLSLPIIIALVGIALVGMALAVFIVVRPLRYKLVIWWRYIRGIREIEEEIV